jgi:hypothetical protein
MIKVRRIEKERHGKNGTGEKQGEEEDLEIRKV